MENSIESLRGYLSSIPPTENFTTEQIDHLIPFLQKSWWDLYGAGEGKMGKGKLERIEKVSWAAPNLRFILERHGGTVMGSSRAELFARTQKIPLALQLPALLFCSILSLPASDLVTIETAHHLCPA